MTSRERVALALEHKEGDRIPLDLGGSPTTGMQANAVYILRQALELDPPGTPVKVIEPFQILGEIKPDLMEALGVDVVPLPSPRGFFGFENENWKEWKLFDGTPVLVPEAFNTDPAPDGSILIYPEGDKSVPASARMPKDGYYFDAIIRQPPIDESKLNPEDNMEEFGPISDYDLAYYAREIDRLWIGTDKAIFGTFGGTGFGDIALVPAPWLKHPKGIRDVAEWYMSTVARRDYIFKVFERQCEIGMANLEKIHKIVGDRVSVVFVTGTDFGAQHGSFISPKSYRDLFKPFHVEVNNWIHKNTKWKAFIHSCGSVWNLYEDFIDAGFDIHNPVQCSAAGMEPCRLKKTHGDKIVFWGGGVDTQRTLPFGTPDEVSAEVRERMRTFGPGGGFVFNTTHNVQARVPTANLLALYKTVKEYGKYPLS